MELMRDDGGFIPLGADVQTDQGVSVGSVGQAGQAWIRGIEDKGTLNIVWEMSPAHPVPSPTTSHRMRKRWTDNAADGPDLPRHSLIKGVKTCFLEPGKKQG